MHTDWYRTKLLDVACKKCPRSKEVEVYIAYMADDASQPGPNNGHIFPIIYYFPKRILVLPVTSRK